MTPAGFSLVDGVTVSCTAGFNCPGACNFAIAGATNTAVKISNGAKSYVNPVSNQFLANETIFLSYNATQGALVLTDAPTLGAIAVLNLDGDELHVERRQPGLRHCSSSSQHHDRDDSVIV